MKLKEVKRENLTEVMYVPQELKKKFSVSRLVSKGSKMGEIQDKITIKKNGISMILDTRKVQNKSMMFYLTEKRYS